MQRKKLLILLTLLLSSTAAWANTYSHNTIYGQPYTQGLGASNQDGYLKTHTITIQVNGGAVQTINHLGAYTGFDVTSVSGVYNNTGSGGNSSVGDWTSIASDPAGNSVASGTGALGYFYSVKSVTVVPKQAGSLTITSVVTDADGVATTDVDNLTVASQSLTIALSGQKTYDATSAFAGSQSATMGSGAVAGDSISSIALPTKNATTYATATGVKIVNSLGQDVTSNYVVSFSGSTAVLPAPVSITNLSGDTKTYDGSSSATVSGSPTLVGVIAGDAVISGGMEHIAAVLASDNSPWGLLYARYASLGLMHNATASHPLPQTFFRDFVQHSATLGAGEFTLNQFWFDGQTVKPVE